MQDPEHFVKFLEQTQLGVGGGWQEKNYEAKNIHDTYCVSRK